MKHLLLLLIVLLSLCSCRSANLVDGQWKSGTYTHKTNIKFKGLKRTYNFHIPQNPPEDHWKLVVVLHGAFNTAKGIEEQSGFSELSDEKGFCVAYPNGIGLFGLLQHWNAGHCCGKAVKDGIDDVAFLNTVIDDLLERYPVDPEHLYFVGHSNGGMMVHRYAAESSERVAAAAVVAGAINSTSAKAKEEWCIPEPSNAVPFLLIHGTADPAVPHKGGNSPDKPEGPKYASVFEAAEFWRGHNKDEAVVEVELLEGWGHDWPGRYFMSKEGVPKGLENYHAADVIWSFFKTTME